MTDEPESGNDFNYAIVRLMINFAALGVVSGLVAMVVFCALTID